MIKFSDFFYKLKNDKIPFFAFIVLFILYFLILFADFFAIYPSTYSNRKLAYQPPSNIYLINKDNKIVHPYTYNFKKTFNNETLTIEYQQDRTQKYKIKLFGKGYEYKLFGIFKTNIHLISKPDDCNLFLLGTDIFNHWIFGFVDIFSFGCYLWRNFRLFWRYY